MSSKRAGLIWVDASGQKVMQVVTTVAGVGAIEAAVDAASNAGVLECWEGLLEQYSPAPATGDYPNVRVSAVLYFTDGAGSTGRLIIPAPDASIFLSDGTTVDPSNSLIVAIIAAAVGSLVCGSGSPATAFVGGQAMQARLGGIATLP